MPETIENARHVWKTRKDNILRAAYASFLSYKDVCDIVQDQRYPVVQNAQLSDNHAAPVRGFVDIRLAGNVLLSDEGKAYTLSISDDPNAPAPDMYHLKHFQVGHSSAVVMIPKDNTKPAIIAFTGTNDKYDWLGNFNFASGLNQHLDCLTHKGFTQMYEQVEVRNGQPVGLPLNQQVLQYLGSHITAEQPLIFTGHSMGGALAGMAAVEWKKHHESHLPAGQKLPEGQIQVVTFAPASLGSKAAEKIAETIGKQQCVAVMKEMDIVPNALRCSQPGYVLVEHQDALAYHMEYRDRLPAVSMTENAGRVAASLMKLNTAIQAHEMKSILDSLKQAVRLDEPPLELKPTLAAKLHAALAEPLSVLPDMLKDGSIRR